MRMPKSTCRVVLAALLASTLAAASPAEPRRCGADRRTALTLTLYGGGFGLVQEVRSLDLPAGSHTLEFADVPSQLDPTSVLVRTRQGAPLRLVEQRYEQDLLSPDRLLQLSVGAPVELVTADDEGEHTTSATLLATQGPLYEIDGKIWLGHPGQIVVPRRPPGLREHPALVWQLEAERGGERSIETTYLTGGMGWSAAYAARISEAEDSLTLEGWATLENNSGIAFDGARLRLVAGDVRHLPQPRLQRQMVATAMEGAMADGGFQEQAAFEQHVYTLDGIVDLPEREPTQVRLRPEEAQSFHKQLTFRGPMYHARSQLQETRGMHPEIELEITNHGAPLPAGTLRVYRESEGGALFVGEDRIDHTPDGATFRVTLGQAFDVEADRIPVDVRAVSSGRYDREVAFRIEIRNHKPTAAAVALREAVPGDWKLLESSPEGRKIDARTLGFEVTVPAQGEAVVTYRVAIDEG